MLPYSIGFFPRSEALARRSARTASASLSAKGWRRGSIASCRSPRGNTLTIDRFGAFKSIPEDRGAVVVFRDRTASAPQRARCLRPPVLFAFARPSGRAGCRWRALPDVIASRLPRTADPRSLRDERRLLRSKLHTATTR